MQNENICFSFFFLEIVFVVNASTTYQEVIGIGGAITDASCSNINNLPDEAQDKLIE